MRINRVMTKASLMLCAVLIVIGASVAYGGEESKRAPTDKDRTVPGTNAETLIRKESINLDIVNLKDLIEIFFKESDGIAKETRTADGRLSTVAMKSGERYEYSYESDENGELKTIQIAVADATGRYTEKCIFTNSVEKDTSAITEGVVGVIDTGVKPPKGDGRPTVAVSIPASPAQPVVITVTHKRIDLEKLSRTPVDLDPAEVKRSLNEYASSRRRADGKLAADVKKWSAAGIVAVENNAGLFRGANINVTTLTDALSAGAGPEGRACDEANAALTDAAARARRAANELKGNSLTDVVPLIEAAGELDGIAARLVGARGAHEEKTEAAMKRLSMTIEQLLHSKIAVFIKSDPAHDKIEAIINLPEEPLK